MGLFLGSHFRCVLGLFRMNIVFVCSLFFVEEILLDVEGIPNHPETQRIYQNKLRNDRILKKVACLVRALDADQAALRVSLAEMYDGLEEKSKPAGKVGGHQQLRDFLAADTAEGKRTRGQDLIVKIVIVDVAYKLDALQAL